MERHFKHGLDHIAFALQYRDILIKCELFGFVIHIERRQPQMKFVILVAGKPGYGPLA